MKRIFYVLLCNVLCVFPALSAQENEPELNNTELFGEMLMNEICKSGFDTNLKLSGNLNLTSIKIKQKIKDEADEDLFSLRENICLKYINSVSDFGYGFEVGINARTANIKQGAPIVDTSYLFLDFEKIGLVKFGYTNTAADSFVISGDTFLLGYQGFGSGYFPEFYNESAGSITSTGFMYDDGKALKIGWISPILKGWFCGVSYTFSSKIASPFRRQHIAKNVGFVLKDDFDQTAYDKKIITAGMSYEMGSEDDFNAKISFAGWLGDGRSDKVCHINDVRAYNLGAILGYKNFKFSCGYTNQGKSFLVKKCGYATEAIGAFDDNAQYKIDDKNIGLFDGANAGKIYSAGMAYTFGKTSFSAGYLQSIKKFSYTEKSKGKVLSIAAEYAVNPMISFYAEYDRIKTTTNDRARAYSKVCDCGGLGNNKANVYMLGTKINI